nr:MULTISPECIES: NAD(P)H-dependent oxidoreductase [unclassified Marinobacterium]
MFFEFEDGRRDDGVHRQIFNHYCEIAAGKFELELGSIAGIPLYDGEDESHPAVEKLSTQIVEADGVIFFSPEYNFSIPGGLKNAIDWLSRCKPQPFAGKPATIIGASPGNQGTARMQYHLRQVGVYLDLHFMNKPEVMIAGVNQKVQAGKIVDQPTIEFLQRHASVFKSFVERHAYSRQDV